MNDLKKSFEILSKNIKEGISKANTEEAIKNISVLPFLKNLGYNVFNLDDVVPEYSFSGDIRTNEKVDYCVFKNGNPVMIIECKGKEKILTKHLKQLSNYYYKISSKFAILTNGTNYQLFTDLDRPNIMDTQPFWELDITNLKEIDYQLLYHLQKD